MYRFINTCIHLYMQTHSLKQTHISIYLFILLYLYKCLLKILYSSIYLKDTFTISHFQVSAKQSRMTATVHLPLKVKGKYFHYILDMRGQFPNAKLFDYSAGLRRNWAQ